MVQVISNCPHCGNEETKEGLLRSDVEKRDTLSIPVYCLVATRFCQLWKKISPPLGSILEGGVTLYNTPLGLYPFYVECHIDKGSKGNFTLGTNDVLPWNWMLFSLYIFFVVMLARSQSTNTPLTLGYQLVLDEFYYTSINFTCHLAAIYESDVIPIY